MRARSVFGVGLALGIVSAIAINAMALDSGDTVQFVVPTSESQPEPDPGPATDKLIYTGGRVTNIDAAGCAAAGSYPLQNVVLVDPGARRSSRIVGVITTFQTGGGTDPVPPGTKITDINFLADCSIGTTTYKKYTGTVE